MDINAVHYFSRNLDERAFSNLAIARSIAKMLSVQTVATIARSADPPLFVLKSKIYKSVEPKLRYTQLGPKPPSI
ncbi:hypothetical protein QUB63_10675 [Microcoleus sp. ARI1-B5]|uniref:hypothetical protein n=1 Tax=unclassified Microcoleus TaxID=2642155 RepID=UPI002FD61F68